MTKQFSVRYHLGSNYIRTNLVTTTSRTRAIKLAASFSRITNPLLFHTGLPSMIATTGEHRFVVLP